MTRPHRPGYDRRTILGAFAVRRLLGAVLVAAACSRADVPLSADIRPHLNAPFTLELGQSAVLDEPAVTVTFTGVPSDSRCPIDVVCVWAGMVAYFVNAMLMEMRYFEYINVLFYFTMGMMMGIYERWVAGQAEDLVRVEAVAEPPPSALRMVRGRR